jgi:hypothetical protein
MIARFVLLKLHEEAMAGRLDFARRALDFLRALPMVQDVRVGLPADADSARSWDLSLQVFLADQAALDAYLADPSHQAFVASEILPRAAVRKAWNFSLL